MKIKLSQTGRRLSVLVGILITMIASGCASQDTAQMVARTKTEANYTVIVHFVDGCPKKVELTSGSPCEPPTDGKLPDDVKLLADGTPLADVELPADLVCARRGEAIVWVSKPAGTRFQVYFDPFVGPPYKSLPPDHKTSPARVHEKSIKGKYEYSVLGLDCKDGNAVLDPPIRVKD